ncbi:Gfo/Idh/MocA family protein [Promicromonospora citrea]|uniref:Oxidoreductase n=1 Tax=Promicromonospora citrea TaxID=43677 RepID=A0A8H9GIH5_9MICO|nr:Gfo/Idh/MocA family oxidoreductase [Promicromonospora citrea]NNH51037.1 Gfo/Idh/MocA family oxidoreductase [Promicromonospora citrea]GGM29774.1 oxidoreductase [Promicromonospora citrea]
MLNVALVGTGNISASHLRAYLQFPERCRVVALCDVVPERAEARKQELGLDDAVVVASHEELLDRQDIDLVSVCTPPSTHAPITIDLLRSGKNVLVEKPMAPSLTDCDAMLRAERESGKVLSVVAQNRFRDDIAVLKEALDSGLLGPVAHLRTDSAWWRGVPYYDLSWRGTWQSEGGGPTLNHAIHHIDLMLWMLGAPQAVAAMMTNAWHDNAEVEDLSVALLQYDRAVAQLTSSVVHHGEEQEIVVQGRDASVAQPWKVRSETTQPNGFPTSNGDTALVARLEELAAAHEKLAHLGHTGQVDDVLAALETGRAPAIGGADGRRTVEVVTAIYQAAIERRTVDLPIPADSPYYTGEGVLENAPRYFTKARSIDDLEGTISVGGEAR